MPKKIAVAVIMGSKSDETFLAPVFEQLDAFDVAWEKAAISAHRQPDRLKEYIASAEKRGVRIFIAAAGLSAALPGAVASQTLQPVIGIPVPGGPLHGMDALLSIIQMPGGIPLATMGLGSHAAGNAALLAVQILSLSDERLARRLKKFRSKLRNG
jgi:5-(carboxyamino)imidazole ribonucleotide mutase